MFRQFPWVPFLTTKRPFLTSMLKVEPRFWGAWYWKGEERARPQAELGMGLHAKLLERTYTVDFFKLFFVLGQKEINPMGKDNNMIYSSAARCWRILQQRRKYRWSGTERNGGTVSGIMSSGSVGSCACAVPAVNHDLMSRSAVPAHRTHNNSWLPTPALIILRIVFMLAQLLFSIMFCPDAHPQLSPLCCRPARYYDLFGGRSILYSCNCNVWLRSVQCIVVLWTVRNVESAFALLLVSYKIIHCSSKNH